MHVGRGLPHIPERRRHELADIGRVFRDHVLADVFPQIHVVGRAHGRVVPKHRDLAKGCGFGIAGQPEKFGMVGDAGGMQVAVRQHRA